MKEKLSALIDMELSELETHQVLEALKRDPELRETWSRFHLVREVMNRQVEIPAPRHLAERVRARLENSPVTTRPIADMLRFTAGFAVAASVMAVAVFTIYTLTGADLPQSPAHSVDAAETRVVQQTPPPILPATTLAEVTEPPEDGIYRYVVGHNEFVPSGHMSGLLPYVHVVAHERDQ